MKKLVLAKLTVLTLLTSPSHAQYNNIHEDAAGNIGIGTTGPDGKLHVLTGSAGSVIPHISFDEFVIEGTGETGMTLVSPDGTHASVAFGSPTDSLGALVQWIYNEKALKIATMHPGGELQFKTGDNIQRAVINSSGNFGIGIPSPAAELDVEGTIRASYGTYFASLKDNQLKFSPPGTSFIDFSTVGKGAIIRTSNLTSGDTTAMSISHNGNVGIGTDQPGEQLHLWRHKPTIKLEEDGGSFTTMYVKNNGTFDISVDRANTMDDSDLRFWIDAAKDPTSPKMVIKETGNVGIGLTDPGSKLDINGNFHALANFNEYTGEGIWDTDNARYCSVSTPHGSEIRFGYQDVGGGQYLPTLGFALQVEHTNCADTLPIIQSRFAHSDGASPEVHNRFCAYPSGRLRWGNGADPLDTDLYRSDSGALKTDGSFMTNGLLGVSTDTTVTTDITRSAQLGNNAIILQGPGGELNSKAGLYASWHGEENGLASGLVFGREGSVWGTYVAFHTHPDGDDIDEFPERMRINREGNVGIGTPSPGEKLTVRGNILVENASGNPVAEIGEGLDYAEGFDVSQDEEIEAGTVLVIDEMNPGKLMVSKQSYDFKVAGIAAGAKGLGSGVRLGVGQFDCDVALAGRVYCNVDATDHAVKAGDLLTTSDTVGHAMKAVNRLEAQGAILGKAMQSLAKGQKGQILVLVTLQ